MNTAPKTTYKGIEITFEERTEKWEFELRGRKMFRGSLADAKKAIDAPPPKDKKPFTRIEAYFAGGYSNDGYKKVVVTSLAEENYGHPTVWISDGTRRSKEMARGLKIVNDKNTAIIEQIKDIDKQRDILLKKKDSLERSLEDITSLLKDVEGA